MLYLKFTLCNNIQGDSISTSHFQYIFTVNLIVRRSYNTLKSANHLITLHTFPFEQVNLNFKQITYHIHGSHFMASKLNVELPNRKCIVWEIPKFVVNQTKKTFSTGTAQIDTQCLEIQNWQMKALNKLLFYPLIHWMFKSAKNGLDWI